MQFLSHQWLEALGARLQESDVVVEQRFALGQIVTDGPEGTVSYVISLGDGPPRLDIGPTDGADVTLVTDYATAAAIARGETASALLATGKLKVRGNAKALLGAQQHLLALTESVSTLNTETEF